MITKLQSFDCYTNSHCQCHRKCTEKSIENMDAHVGMKRINPLTPKISLVILLTVCQTIIIMFVWRIWYQIN